MVIRAEMLALAVTVLLGSAASEEIMAESCASSPEGCLAEAGEEASLIQMKSPAEEVQKEECGPRSANSPSDYVSCWEDGEFCCVGDNLFGSVMAPDPSLNATVYPANRSFAWYGSSDDLQTALQLRKKFGADSPQTTIGIEVAVGFNPLATSWGDPGAPTGFFWLVLEQPEGVPLVTPTFAEWFNIYTHRGFTFSYEAVKEILLTYANLEKNGHPHDVLNAWKKLTGCSRKCSSPITGSVKITRECGCCEDAVNAYDIVKPWLEDTTPGNSDACFQALFDEYPDANAAMLRVAFHACNDALPVYTGFGLGYNTIVNPLISKGYRKDCRFCVDDRYGGREFTMENLQIWQLNNTGTARQIPLTAVPEEQLNSPPLTDKFCLR